MELIISVWIRISCYHLYTLWLFTLNDLKTMVFPSTAFAWITACALLQESTGPIHNKHRLLIAKIPFIIFWAWLNTLSFNINNQRQPRAIEEDRLNKPWRPMPENRLTDKQAKVLAIVIAPLPILMSMAIDGGLNQSILLVLLGYAYNDLGMGNASWLIRNGLNACGFTSFASGALEVALGSPTPSKIVPWLFMIGTVVATTVHTQDMYDQVGDRAAGRRTIPLVFGDGVARCSIALAIPIWSWLCPLYWSSKFSGFLIPVVLGFCISGRSLAKRTVVDDRDTFRLYNVWLVSIYCSPFFRY